MRTPPVIQRPSASLVAIRGGGTIPSLPVSLRRRRRGLTLLEVILATGIFVASLAMIGQLLRLGLDAAVWNQMATQALLRCESKIEELTLGIEPLSPSAEGVPFPDDPRWLWQAETESTPVAGLLFLTVRVEFRPDPNAVAQSESLHELSLRRFVLDPAWYQASPAAPPEGTQPITVRTMLGLPPRGTP